MGKKSPQFMVVIGASAGGLEALNEFLSSYDVDSDTVTLVAQHLDPKHPTILRDLLSRATDLPITLLNDSTFLESGQIYIVPPGVNAEIVNKQLVLSPASEVGPKPSISRLLSTAAKSYGEHLIAVILSGTGSDGAQGVMDVKAASGLSFVQEPSTARYDGMPNAAIDTGMVDKVLPAKEIAVHVQNMINIFESGKHDIVTNGKDDTTTSHLLDQIFQRILEQTGYDFSGYKSKTINRRINRRMAVNRIENLEDYVILLQSENKEVQALFKDLLISVTEFFRDTEQFEELREQLDLLVKEVPASEGVRVWVPGCANGEEAYSIAFLLHDLIYKSGAEITYQVFATDIDEAALERGRLGVFAASSVDGFVADDFKQRFFKKIDQDQYQVIKHIRDRVLFAKHNLVMDPPFSKIDLISCRNLLIYFSPELQRRIFQTFHFSLKPRCLIFLGKSESPSNIAPEYFDLVTKKAQIFKRKSLNISPRLSFHEKSYLSNASRKSGTVSKSRGVTKERTLSDLLDDAVKQALMPDALVINSTGEILHISGHMDDYLTFATGELGTNIYSLIRKDFKLDVRALVQKATRDGQAFSQVIFYQKQDGERFGLILVIEKVVVDFNQELYALGFFNLKNALDFQGQSETENFNYSIDFLQNEVNLYKSRLHETIEDLELTNQELQTINEELQSSNEELHSTNEELQTSNEELQSTNEELVTVNEELEIKGLELEQVNSDLEHMLENMNEIIILIDNRLRLLRYTHAARDILGFESTDIGQSIISIGLKFDVIDFRSKLINVIESKQSMVLTTRLQKEAYDLSIKPLFNVVKEIKGIAMVLSQRFEVSGNNESGWEPYHLMGSLSDQMMIIIDQQGVMLYVNAVTEAMTGFTQDDLLYQNISILMPAPFANAHNVYIEDYLEGKSSGVMNQRRQVTYVRKDHQRALAELIVSECEINQEPMFIGLMSPCD